MSSLSRRKFIGVGLGTAAMAGLTPFAFTQRILAQPGNLTSSNLSLAELFNIPIEKAFRFQNTMMDAYAEKETVRLMQSYADQSGLESTAFTYDNAVSIHAYLIQGGSYYTKRAEVLGDGLIYAQENNFPVNDGRFGQAYFVNTAAADGAFITPAAFPFYFYSSSVGDQAWAGMALAQLYNTTQKPKYLTAALNVANWIVANTYDTKGPGGYRFGTTINPQNQSVPSTNGKSTEHNIDTFAFFTMLAKLTGNANAANGMSWSSLAEHALIFVTRMWNATDGYFFTGTLGDQVSINYYPVPEDCQTWSYLATFKNSYKGSIDWALKNLQTTDTASSKDSSLTGTEQITGMVFDSASLNTTQYDPNAVWIEGTSHTIAALLTRTAYGDPANFNHATDFYTALNFLENCNAAQAELGGGQTVAGVALPSGCGMVASTSVMDTGFGYTYGPTKHIGATGWYLIAVLGGNPFQLGYAKVNATD